VPLKPWPIRLQHRWEVLSRHDRYALAYSQAPIRRIVVRLGEKAEASLVQFEARHNQHLHEGHRTDDRRGDREGGFRAALFVAHLRGVRSYLS
jgi:hypothetical protein